MILKWPQCRKIDFQDRDRSAIVLHLDAKIAPNGPNWFQMIPNDPKWSQMIPKWHEYLQIDFRNHFHQNSAPLAVVLSGHMTSLRQFWIWGPKLARNGPKMAPKWPQMTSSLQGDFWNHLHRNSAPLAVILSGHMTSLRQIWVWGQKWPKIAPKWPKMA